jgi:hypothetical protein
VILQERSTNIWKQKLQWIASQGGMALLNVHPDYAAPDESSPDHGEYEMALYGEFLKWIKQTYAGQYWSPLPKDIAAFYRNTHVNTNGHATRSQFAEVEESVQHDVAGRRCIV